MKKVAQVVVLGGLTLAFGILMIRGLFGTTVSAKFSSANASVRNEYVFGYDPPSRFAPAAEVAPYGSPPPPARLTGEPSRSAKELSTFAIDVDTASYTIARSALRQGWAPASEQVRVEEFLNYFRYDYMLPPEGRPALVQIEAAKSPIDAETVLMRIGIQGGEPAVLPPVHLTFLVDVSGSMFAALPLAQESMHAAVASLRPSDRVAIVTYSGRTEVVLESTRVSDTRRIHCAINSLRAGGGTAMGEAMEMAYEVATRHAGPNNVSHVMVMSDGDANIGTRNPRVILDAIKGGVADGVTLSTVGYSNGAYNDEMMEVLADAGNGNYTYIDTSAEVERVFVQRLHSMLHVIAKDVKVQVEFNDLAVAGWKQVGYENRQLSAEQFRDDRVDAGELGAGHQVTALYEVTLRPTALPTQELATARFRYKDPKGATAKEVSTRVMVRDIETSIHRTSTDFRFQAALALFAQGLKEQRLHAGLVKELTEESVASHAERREILELINLAANAQQPSSWQRSQQRSGVSF